MFVLKINLYFMKKIYQLVLLGLFLPVLVLAQEASSTTSGEVVPLDNPLRATDVSSFVASIINAVLGVVGAVALLYFVLGGLTWMTSQGNQDKVKRGKETITWATFGIVAIFFSYVIVNFVIERLLS